MDGMGENLSNLELRDNGSSLGKGSLGERSREKPSLEQGYCAEDDDVDSHCLAPAYFRFVLMNVLEDFISHVACLYEFNFQT